jgi:hypothetical protein
MNEREVKMRAANLSNFMKLTKEQQDELIQLLKTDTLTPIKSDDYYVMKGYHLISMFDTLVQKELLIEDYRRELRGR